MKQFKVGDKVKIIGAQEGIENMQNMIGMICTICETSTSISGYTLKEDRHKYIWSQSWLIKKSVLELE